MRIQLIVLGFILSLAESGSAADYDIKINLTGGKKCPQHVTVDKRCSLNFIAQSDLACPVKSDKIVFKLTGKPNNDVDIIWPGLGSADAPLRNCIKSSSGNSKSNRTITCDYNPGFPLDKVAKYTIRYKSEGGQLCDLDPRIIITN